MGGVKRDPKTIWEGVSIHSEKSQVALRSWFCGLVADNDEPVKASILTRISDDRSLKIRALFKSQDGTLREMTRTLGNKFSVTIKPPTSQGCP